MIRGLVNNNSSFLCCLFNCITTTQNIIEFYFVLLYKSEMFSCIFLVNHIPSTVSFCSLLCEVPINSIDKSFEDGSKLARFLFYYNNQAIWIIYNDGVDGKTFQR